MLSVKLFVCLSVLYVGANAAVFLLMPQEKPEKYAHLEGCYVPELDDVLKYGEIRSPADGRCLKYSCDYDGQTDIFTCGAFSVTDAGCEKVEGDLTQPQPKCCSGYKCKQSDGSYKLYPYGGSNGSD